MKTLSMRDPYLKAAYLSERTLDEPMVCSPEDGWEELSSWMAKTKSSKEEFAARLNSRGLSLDEFRRLLIGKDSPTVPPMRWLEEKERIISSTPDEWIQANLYIGIGVLTLPFIHTYSEQIRRWFPEGADKRIAIEPLMNALRSNQIYHLRFVADRTAVYMFHLEKENEPDLTFEAFVRKLGSAREIDRRLQEYPVLARVMTEMTIRAIRNTIEILERYLNDYEVLNERFFQGRSPLLLNIQQGAGDSHQDGRSVAILHLDHGYKLVYKPRSLDMDVAFADWLSDLSGRGLRYSLRTPLVVSRASYGWQQFVEHRPCQDEDEVKRYYYRIGVLCCLFYAMQSTDMHYENLIACGDMPYVIDNETLLPNKIINVDKLIFPVTKLFHSIYHSGLVPSGQLLRSRVDFDLSAISGKPNQVSANLKNWVLVEGGADEVKYVEQHFRTSHEQHLVMLDGKIVEPVHYLQEISDGFSDMYRILSDDIEMTKMEIRKRFGMLSGRALIRPTYMYGRFLIASLHPQYLRNGLDREKLLEMMWNITKSEPLLERIVPAEIADLLNNDIPYFTYRVDDTSLYTSDHTRIPDVFKKTSLQWMDEKLDGFCEEDLAFQLRLLKYSIHSAHVSDMQLPEAEALDRVGPPVLKKAFDPMETAVDIADYLIEHRLTDHQYTAWAGLTNHDNQFRLSLLDHSIYGGSMGIAMFLGLIYKLTRKQEYKDAAMETYRFIMSMTERIGDEELIPSAFNGRGAFIYAGYFLDSVMGFPEGRETARLLLEAIRNIETEEEKYDRGQDNQAKLEFLNGYAGIVTLCLEIWESFADESALHTGRIYGDRLCHLLGQENVELAGFAHGSSGILYALQKMVQAKLLPPENDLIRQMLQFEEQHYERSYANWKDLRTHIEEPYSSMYWCHGAPGVLLGRSGMGSDWLDAEDRRRILDAIVQHASTNPRVSLCHGVFGIIDILLTLREHPDWSEHESEIDAAVWRLANRPDLLSRIEGMKDRGLVSLMLGVSGVAWACLRMVDPRLPSVLTLQMPDQSIGTSQCQEVGHTEEVTL